MSDKDKLRHQLCVILTHFYAQIELRGGKVEHPASRKRLLISEFVLTTCELYAFCIHWIIFIFLLMNSKDPDTD